MFDKFASFDSNFINFGSIVAFLALNGTLSTDANGNRFLINPKGDDVPIASGDAIHIEGASVASYPITSNTNHYTVVPTIYGFGTSTRAAYGGNILPVVLHVDTLISGVSNTDSTHGSFEWAITRNYPRVVVFDVSGLIQCADYAEINSPYITIAGQTAPSNIAFDGELRCYTHDVLVQHIAIRNSHNFTDRDGISINNYNNVTNNIVFDSCSVSWGTDENLAVWDSTNSSFGNITFSRCLVAEGLYPHSCGVINMAQGVDVQSCLFAHHNNRHPYVKRGSETAFFNNLLYNYSYRAGQINDDGEFLGVCKLDYRGNVTKSGLDTNGADAYPLMQILDNYPDNALELHMSDNISNGTLITSFDVEDLNTPNKIGYEATTNVLSLPNGTIPYPSAMTYDHVLAVSGARAGNRDEFDTRIVNEVINGNGGGKITSPPTMPTYKNLTVPFVEVANPHDYANEHYTNLEVQLHNLADAASGINSINNILYYDVSTKKFTQSISPSNGNISVSHNHVMEISSPLSNADLEALNIDNSLMLEVLYNGLILDSGFNSSYIISFYPAIEGYNGFDIIEDVTKNRLTDISSNMITISGTNGDSIANNGNGTSTLTMTATSNQAIQFVMQSDGVGVFEFYVESYSETFNVVRWYDGASSRFINYDIKSGKNRIYLGTRTGTSRIYLYIANSTASRAITFRNTYSFTPIENFATISNFIYGNTIRSFYENSSFGLQKLAFDNNMIYTAEQMNFYAGDAPQYVQDLTSPLSIKETLKNGTVYLWTYNGTTQKLYKDGIEQANATVNAIRVGEISRLNGETVAEIDTFELFNIEIKPREYYKWLDLFENLIISSNDDIIIASSDNYVLSSFDYYILDSNDRRVLTSNDGYVLITTKRN